MDASNLAAMLQLVTTEKIDVVFDLAVVPLPRRSSSRPGRSKPTWDHVDIL